MENHNQKRKKFIEKLSMLSNDEKIGIHPSFVHQNEGSNIIVRWNDTSLKKVFLIQEALYQNTLAFDAFTLKSGLGGEINDLCVITRNTDTEEFVRKVWFLYKKWFIENLTPEEIQDILERLNQG